MRDPRCSCFDEYGWYHRDYTKHDPDCRSFKPPIKISKEVADNPLIRPWAKESAQELINSLSEPSKPKLPLETIRDAYAETIKSINFESMSQTSLAEALAQTNRIYSRRQRLLDTDDKIK